MYSSVPKDRVCDKRPGEIRSQEPMALKHRVDTYD